MVVFMVTALMANVFAMNNIQETNVISVPQDSKTATKISAFLRDSVVPASMAIVSLINASVKLDFLVMNAIFVQMDMKVLIARTVLQTTLLTALTPSVYRELFAIS